MGDVYLNLWGVQFGKFLGNFFPDQLGSIAVATEMCAENMLQIGMDKLLKEVGCIFIG